MSKAPRKQLVIKYSIQDQFFFACHGGDLNKVNELCTNGIQVNQANENGTTPLNIACQNGHSKVVEILLAVDGILVNQADDDGFAPLNIACWEGHLKVVDMLLDIKYYIRRLVYIA